MIEYKMLSMSAHLFRQNECSFRWPPGVIEHPGEERAEVFPRTSANRKPKAFPGRYGVRPSRKRKDDKDAPLGSTLFCGKTTTNVLISRLDVFAGTVANAMRLMCRETPAFLRSGKPHACRDKLEKVLAETRVEDGVLQRIALIQRCSEAN